MCPTRQGEGPAAGLCSSEADDRIEQCIDDIFIEANGGGQKRELPERRLRHRLQDQDRPLGPAQPQGHVFFFGDEMNHPFRKEEVINLIGTDDEKNLPQSPALRDLYDMVKERHHTSLCCPRTPTMAAIREVLEHWKVLLGSEAVLQLADESAAERVRRGRSA